MPLWACGRRGPSSNMDRGVVATFAKVIGKRLWAWLDQADA